MNKPGTTSSPDGKALEADARVVLDVEAGHRVVERWIPAAQRLREIRLQLLDDLLAEHLLRVRRKGGFGLRQEKRRQERSPEDAECQLHTAVLKDPARGIDQQGLCPGTDIKRLRLIELIVCPADKPMQILNGVRRKLIRVGQRQVGAGCAVQRGESGDRLGVGATAPRPIAQLLDSRQFCRRCSSNWETFIGYIALVLFLLIVAL